MIQIYMSASTTPLLNVTFIYVSKYTDDNIFSREFSYPVTKVPRDEHSNE